MTRLALIPICAVFLNASDERKPELPPEVRPLVGLARAAPPELFADAIVKLVEAGKIPQRELQIQLLEDAFSAAAGAKQPLPLAGPPSIPPDTRAMFRSRAARLNLDALSLQSHILKALLTVDRAKARELFDHIRRPSVDRASCDDPLIVDDSAYFEIAGAIAQSGFTTEEKDKDAHVQFLIALLAGARSPNEIAPFLRSLDSVALKPPQLELVAGAIAGRLEAISADYRPFALSLDALNTELSRFIELAGANGIGTVGLLRGYRSYLVTQLKAPRCQPDFPVLVDQLPLVQQLSPALTQDEMTPARRDDMFKVEPYFQSEDSQRLGEALKRLGSRTLPAPEFRNALADVLRDFAGWHPEGSDMDVFHQKATVLAALLQATAAGEDRDRILNLCVAFLQSSNAERQSPGEWLWQVRSLMEAAAADGPKLIEGFRGSTSVGLTLYAAMNGNL